MKTKPIILIFCILLLIVACSSKKYDGFVSCLNEKYVKFYGAFWCPHCQNQKSIFGSSAKNLPYIECSTPDGKGQLDVCKEKNVKSYPTWDFPDGTRLTGELSLQTLSEKTGCKITE